MAIASTPVTIFDGEPTRARYPDATGFVERDGVRTFYEVYGDGEPTLLLLPTWSLVHSRFWKAQIPYLARHFRVVTFDGRGNGRSDRPQSAAAYAPNELAEDALAVMDATETDSAITVSASAGTTWNLFLASQHPQRVGGAVFIGPLFPVTGEYPAWARQRLREPRSSYEDAGRYNLHHIRDDLADFAKWWAELALPEPHSSMQIEYTVEWALSSDGQTIAHTLGAADMLDVDTMAEVFEAIGPMLQQLAEAVQCPVLVIEGALDAITPPDWARALADATGGEYRELPGIGHVPGRKPIPFNLAIAAFARQVRKER